MGGDTPFTLSSMFPLRDHPLEFEANLDRILDPTLGLTDPARRSLSQGPAETFQTQNRRHSLDHLRSSSNRRENLRSSLDTLRPATAHSRLPSGRPLSDIREDTEPNLAEALSGLQVIPGEVQLGASNILPAEQARVYPELNPKSDARPSLLDRTLNRSSSSVLSLPLASIPPRRSSNRLSRRDSVANTPFRPAIIPAPASSTGQVASKPFQSGPKGAEAYSFNYISQPRRSYSETPRTFTRLTQYSELLEFPQYRHPRVELDIRIPATLYMGGGNIQGKVYIVIDGGSESRGHRGTGMAVSRVAIDLLGVEEVSNGRRSIFLTLANELVDLEHPPPSLVLAAPELAPRQEVFWMLAPSKFNLPFRINLPLDVGPAPFVSRHARIRYILCATMLIKDAERQYFVRKSIDVGLLSVFDPEKTLIALPSPLSASDETIARRSHPSEKIQLTAALHRQVWISGTSIFVDVHIVNRTHKWIKKLDIELQRNISFYKNTPASTLDKTVHHLRASDFTEKEIAARGTIKKGWKGVAPLTNELRTCELEVPRGHSTVKSGRYFEVRYFLNVLARSKFSKLLMVQLPVIIIHMNTLDVIPNSINQVVAAIEDNSGDIYQHEQPPLRKHSSRSVIPGRAFSAPRKQSLSRLQVQQRQQKEDIAELTRILDSNPQKAPPRTRSFVDTYVPIMGDWKKTLNTTEGVPLVRRTLRRASSNEPPARRAQSGASALGINYLDETEKAHGARRASTSLIRRGLGWPGTPRDESNIYASRR